MTAIPIPIAAVLSKRFERIVVFSGAGMSAESGIATFRCASDGLWARFNPAELATPGAWRAQRNTVWAWYEWRRAQVLAATPNPGHRAVARLQQAGIAQVVTQNVDDLHERAGAQEVVHLHGSLMHGRCTACHRPQALGNPPPMAPEMEPPRCTHCGGYIRPAVVWFGESLPEAAMVEASRRIASADLLLIVGTSGVVQPAAGMVRLAPADCVVVEINPAADSSGSGGTRLNWAAPAGEALPLLADRVLAS
jgi:NAD-dependent deacetylase